MKRSKLAIIAAGLSLVAGAPALADITFIANYIDDAEEGFNDLALGAQRRAAFEFALNIWGQQFSSTYAGETILVNAAFDPLGGTGTSAVLGSANSILTRDFGASHPEYLASTWYSMALANHLAGTDINAEDYEINATFNSDVDNGTVLGSTNWYYGTDGNPASHIDFVSVALHEVGHGLNFSAIVNSLGQYLEAPGGSGAKPGIYDRFLEDLSGTDLVNMGSNAARAAAITSGNLFWNGAGGIAGNGGARPELFAPSPYQPGSSVSHLDEGVHGGQLMSPLYSGPDHTFSAMELGMFDDMGWTLIPEPASLGLLALAGLLLLRRRTA